MWLKGLFKQREGNMNTIAVTTTEGVVNYTESDITRLIERAGNLSDVKYKVRDFFSELEWESNEATITRSEVNTLLKSIGCDVIRGEYKATITITAYVTGYEADDADDAADCIADDIEVSIGSSATINVDNIEVDDVEDDN
jgi:hypothetical protein